MELVREEVSHPRPEGSLLCAAPLERPPQDNKGLELVRPL